MLVKKCLRNLDETGMVYIGAEVKSGDISYWKSNSKR